MRTRDKCFIVFGILFACVLSWLTSEGITSVWGTSDNIEQISQLEDSLDVCLTNLERVRRELHDEPDNVSNLERMLVMEYEMQDTVYPGIESPESDR